ncbi:hypothetical protein [Microlunatus endophyticus]|uniref:hypothetical protein n=1 Tax=Microlunatus endophyticus TaxID=1716077 RepID=UPI00166F418C|nr:hypothetical protein [Microlunatus endophyticus]
MVEHTSGGIAGRTGTGALRWLAVVVAFSNLGIHVYLAPMHLDEKFYIGVLFLAGSGALAVAIVGLATDRDRLRTAAWLLGTATSVVMFLAFVASRTVGLPGGYLETWAQGPEDVMGLASLGLEVVFVGCCLASITIRDTTVPDNGQARRGVFGRIPLHDRTAPLA